MDDKILFLFNLLQIKAPERVFEGIDLIIKKLLKGFAKKAGLQLRTKTY